jgi:hypothetical protein
MPAGGETMLDPGAVLPVTDRAFLLRLQRQALQYFLDNQVPGGLVLDRQSNHGPLRPYGLCSLAATGMGLIALALASAPPYRLLSRHMALRRVGLAVRAVHERLPHDQGVLPHFTNSVTDAVYGFDRYSTIDTAWLITGALWAAAFLRDAGLEREAVKLYERIDWHYWTAPGASNSSLLIRHGKGADGRFLGCAWDRLNGETAFLYVLAAGAGDERAISSRAWMALRPFYGTVGGLRFNNADLGLFVFQYGLDLLDLDQWRAPGDLDLHGEARLATLANRQVCQELAGTYGTYRRYWGLSAGDGPGDAGQRDVYRCYAPSGPIDGTAHLMATLASVAHAPSAVLENLRQAQHDFQRVARGRYGFGNINVDRKWVSRDVVGIDAGAAVLALDNYLVNQRVRRIFQELPCVQRGLGRLGFARVAALRQAS